jgi:hypothetical protein
VNLLFGIIAEDKGQKWQAVRAPFPREQRTGLDPELKVKREKVKN